MKIKFTSILLLVVLGMHSCVSESGKEKKDSPKEDVITGFGETTEQLREVYYRFPSPDEMFSYVHSENLTFDPTILTPVEKSGDLIEAKNQKICLGYYLADLAYITLFERYKESMDYLRVIHNLSEKTRIDGAFDKKFANRIEDNIKNIDSLKVISGDALDMLINFLSANQMQETFALISLGGFVEVLYISTNLVDEYEAENATIRRIAEQKYVLRNLQEFVLNYRSDKAVYETLQAIQPIIDIYNSLEVEERKTAVNKDKEGKVVFSGGNKIIFTEEQYKELKAKTAEIREKLL